MNKILLVIAVLFLCSQVVYSAQLDNSKISKVNGAQIEVSTSGNNNDIAKSELGESSKSEVLPYDYSSVDCVPIKLSITSEVSTKDDILEGQKLEYRVLDDVYYKDKLILKKGDIVPATLETIVTSGMNGFPAEIVVDDFQIPGVKNSQLLSVYIKKGQNRCFWVYPLKWALTIIPFVGSLTNLIMGGHAKLKTRDVVTLYYFPDWK